MLSFLEDLHMSLEFQSQHTSNSVLEHTCLTINTKTCITIHIPNPPNLLDSFITSSSKTHWWYGTSQLPFVAVFFNLSRIKNDRPQIQRAKKVEMRIIFPQFLLHALARPQPLNLCATVLRSYCKHPCFCRVLKILGSDKPSPLALLLLWTVVPSRAV